MDVNDITELYNTQYVMYELHLDHSAQVLYWSTYFKIWSMSVDGSNPRVLLPSPNYIYGLALWNNVVYWTDRRGIHSITKDGSSNAILVESLHTTCYSYNYSHNEQSFEDYDNIAIISGNKQRPGMLDFKNVLSLAGLIIIILVTQGKTYTHRISYKVLYCMHVHPLPPQVLIPVVITMVAAVNSVS